MSVLWGSMVRHHDGDEDRQFVIAQRIGWGMFVIGMAMAIVLYIVALVTGR